MNLKLIYFKMRALAEAPQLIINGKQHPTGTNKTQLLKND